MCDEPCSWQGSKRGASLAEHEQALAFLAGLHPCLTIDGPPMAVAERIFDAVMAERRELQEQIANQERNLDLMRQHLRKGTPNGKQT